MNLTLGLMFGLVGASRNQRGYWRRKGRAQRLMVSLAQVSHTCVQQTGTQCPAQGVRYTTHIYTCIHTCHHFNTDTLNKLIWTDIDTKFFIAALVDACKAVTVSEDVTGLFHVHTQTHRYTTYLHALTHQTDNIH